MEALREIICCKRIYFFFTNGIIEVCAAALNEEAESSAKSLSQALNLILIEEGIQKNSEGDGKMLDLKRASLLTSMSHHRASYS